METGVRVLRLEAEDIPVRNVVSDGGKACLKALRGSELEVLAAGKMGDSLRNVPAKTICRRNGDHLDQGKRRRELSKAVIELNGLIVCGVWVGIGIGTHAAGRRVRAMILKQGATRLARELAIRVVHCF